MNGRYLRSMDCRYVVSSSGAIWSLFGPRGLRQKPVPLTPTEYRDGYLKVTLTNGRGVRRKYAVHRCVAEAFMDLDCADTSVQVHHIDGNKKNNDVANLCLVTRKENIAYAVRDGCFVRKEKQEFSAAERKKLGALFDVDIFFEITGVRVK